MSTVDTPCADLSEVPTTDSFTHPQWPVVQEPAQDRSRRLNLRPDRRGAILGGCRGPLGSARSGLTMAQWSN